MRKIEKQLLAAIKARKDWTLNNTGCFFVSASESGNVAGSRTEIYLHGNHIADYWHDLAEPLEVDSRTLARYPTVTTKSRLRALGANVMTKKGVTYLNDAPVMY